MQRQNLSRTKYTTSQYHPNYFRINKQPAPQMAEYFQGPLKISKSLDHSYFLAEGNKMSHASPSYFSNQENQGKRNKHSDLFSI